LRAHCLTRIRRYRVLPPATSCHYSCLGRVLQCLLPACRWTPVTSRGCARTLACLLLQAWHLPADYTPTTAWVREHCRFLPRVLPGWLLRSGFCRFLPFTGLPAGRSASAFYLSCVCLPAVPLADTLYTPACLRVLPAHLETLDLSPPLPFLHRHLRGFCLAVTAAPVSAACRRLLLPFGATCLGCLKRLPFLYAPASAATSCLPFGFKLWFGLPYLPACRYHCLPACLAFSAACVARTHRTASPAFRVCRYLPAPALTHLPPFYLPHGLPTVSRLTCPPACLPRGLVHPPQPACLPAVSWNRLDFLPAVIALRVAGFCLRLAFVLPLRFWMDSACARFRFHTLRWFFCCLLPRISCLRRFCRLCLLAVCRLSVQNARSFACLGFCWLRRSYNITCSCCRRGFCGFCLHRLNASSLRSGFLPACGFCLQFLQHRRLDSAVLPHCWFCWIRACRAWTCLLPPFLRSVWVSCRFGLNRFCVDACAAAFCRSAVSPPPACLPLPAAVPPATSLPAAVAFRFSLLAACLGLPFWVEFCVPLRFLPAVYRWVPLPSAVLGLGATAAAVSYLPACLPGSFWNRFICRLPFLPGFCLRFFLLGWVDACCTCGLPGWVCTWILPFCRFVYCSSAAVFCLHLPFCLRFCRSLGSFVSRCVYRWILTTCYLRSAARTHNACRFAFGFSAFSCLLPFSFTALLLLCRLPACLRIFSLVWITCRFLMDSAVSACLRSAPLLWSAVWVCTCHLPACTCRFLVFLLCRSTRCAFSTVRSTCCACLPACVTGTFTCCR